MRIISARVVDFTSAIFEPLVSFTGRAGRPLVAAGATLISLVTASCRRANRSSDGISALPMLKLPQSIAISTEWFLAASARSSQRLRPTPCAAPTNRMTSVGIVLTTFVIRESIGLSMAKASRMIVGSYPASASSLAKTAFSMKLGSRRRLFSCPCASVANFRNATRRNTRARARIRHC